MLTFILDEHATYVFSILLYFYRSLNLILKFRYNLYIEFEITEIKSLMNRTISKKESFYYKSLKKH
jgi:hypothetical protein